MKLEGVLALVLLASCSKTSAPDDAAASFESGSPPVTASAPTTAPVAHDCEDGNALWYSSGADAAAYETALRGWIPVCREAAMRKVCAMGCSEVISDHVVASAADAAEKRSLIEIRHDKNEQTLTDAKVLWQQVKDLETYALGLRGTPRATTPECIQRMRVDFDRIDLLSKRIEQGLPHLPEGMGGLMNALSLAKNCVSCAPDLSTCDDMKEPINDNAQNFRDQAKLIAKDAKRLK